MNNKLNDFFCGDYNQNGERYINPFLDPTWDSYSFYL